MLDDASAEQQIASYSHHNHPQAEENYAGPTRPQQCQTRQDRTETAAKVIERKVEGGSRTLSSCCLLAQVEIDSRHGREHAQRQQSQADYYDWKSWNER